MKLLKNTWCLIGVTLVSGLFGCTDQPMASDPFPSTSAVDAGFDALEWREPIGQEVVARQIIGPAGGVIRLRGIGVEISFPEGAVSESVLVEARALAGSVVAFEFEAHGLTFGVPIEIRIDSEGLAGRWSDLFGVLSEKASPSRVTPPPAGVSGGPRPGSRALPVDSLWDSIVIEIIRMDRESSFFSVELFGYAVASG